MNITTDNLQPKTDQSCAENLMDQKCFSCPVCTNVRSYYSVTHVNDPQFNHLFCVVPIVVRYTTVVTKKSNFVDEKKVTLSNDSEISTFSAFKQQIFCSDYKLLWNSMHPVKLTVLFCSKQVSPVCRWTLQMPNWIPLWFSTKLLSMSVVTVVIRLPTDAAGLSRTVLQMPRGSHNQLTAGVGTFT